MIVVEEDLDISVDFFRYDMKLLLFMCVNANYFYPQITAFDKVDYAYLSRL